MSRTVRQSLNNSNVLSVVMGGGQGSRLFPLTKYRAKPAVPLAGKYRLVDIPISNCINSGLRRLYILTQFNSVSLHRHISQTYKFDQFSSGFVEVLAAQQTFTDDSWYQGTADAVRKNLAYFMNHDWDYLLILSGDQLYRMNFQQIITQHAETGAEVTIATIPVPRAQAQGLGIMQVAADRQIVRFVEKPKEPAVLDSLQLQPEWYKRLGIHHESEELLLASMGIYVFNRDVIIRLLENALVDFGKHIIPNAIDTHRVYSFVYQGYWEDIGTIRSFFEANLDIASELPRFNFFDMTAPIFSRPRFLPGSKINGAHVDHAIVTDGCIINHSRISNSIVGLRSVVGEGCELRRVVSLGCDYFESAESIRENEQLGRPRVGIGRNTRIENTIIDKDARIGDNCVISPAGKPESVNHDLYFIRDGIVIIPKNGIIPHGTVI
ncbi:MAG TPA: glucose-1-phosphate adenylyltransferase [Verrucomicrobiota bacterium]|nr:MAG: Glucose-1-phosphate adenylyltransferase [Verrucomicrobia bacterium ADurb.Bin118]HPY30853.1 glucose-1-phosphate adenylyltransferase [Verrucomicrobiota bacterium]HQB17171.1 glucose-1-phosphate adenylyltransferase [Verrucomicrobiota bacterium]